MIKLSKVSFSYHTPEGLIPAVKEVSLQMKEGEFVALLGSNGSGKSTLCKLMAGLLVPQEGEINGSLETDALRPLVGLMLANPEDQLVCPLVEEEVAFGLQNLGVPYAELIERVQESLRVLSLVPLRRKLTYLLSGGEQQKVVLAALLALNPRCLILDEATSFLDSAQQGLVRNSILRLHKEHGLGIIWSTPCVEEVLLAERVLVLHNSEIVFDGSPQQLLVQAGGNEDWGLLWPDLYCLMDELKSSGVTFSESRLESKEISHSLVPREGKLVSNSNQTDSNQQNSSVLISVKDLTYHPPLADKSILSQINLQVHEGDFLGISGHTGCGKSTLLQHLNGLLQPSSGQVCLEGVNIHDHHKHVQEARRQIGLVFQYPERQFFHSEISEEMAFAPRHAGMIAEEINQNCEEVLSWLDLDYQQLRTRSPYELSGGEKRKLAMACVLVTKPRILMLDEPTAGLDGYSKRGLLATIKRLQQEVGLTIIMVSHDLPEIINMTEKILLLHEGELYWNGFAEDLLEKPELLPPLGLPLPPLWELVSQLKRRQKEFSPSKLTVGAVHEEIKRCFVLPVR